MQTNHDYLQLRDQLDEAERKFRDNVDEKQRQQLWHACCVLQEMLITRFGIRGWFYITTGDESTYEACQHARMDRAA